MLIAVEGPPAVGKTRWLKEFPPYQVIGVDVGGGPLPDPLTPEAAAARAQWNIRRWDALITTEKRYGRAYADTDPLGLYRAFSLLLMGESPREAFDEAYRAAREAMEAQTLGFVDHVVLLTASPEKLTERNEADTERERPQFVARRNIGIPMEAYYAELETLRPGTVHPVNAEPEIKRTGTAFLYRLDRHELPRYDLEILDALKDALDALLPVLAV